MSGKSRYRQASAGSTGSSSTSHAASAVHKSAAAPAVSIKKAPSALALKKAEARQKTKAEAPGQREKSTKVPSILNYPASQAVKQAQIVKEESTRLSREASPPRPTASIGTSEPNVASSEARTSVPQSKSVVAEKRLQAILVSVATSAAIMSDSHCADQDHFDPFRILGAFRRSRRRSVRLASLLRLDTS